MRNRKDQFRKEESFFVRINDRARWNEIGNELQEIQSEHTGGVAPFQSTQLELVLGSELMRVINLSFHASATDAVISKVRSVLEARQIPIDVCESERIRELIDKPDRCRMLTVRLFDLLMGNRLTETECEQWLKEHEDKKTPK